MLPFAPPSHRQTRFALNRLALFLMVLAAMLPASELHAAQKPIVFTGAQTQPFSGSGKGIAVDSSGNVYLASGSVVYKETARPGGFTRSTVVSNAQGLGSAVAVAVDSSGNVYVADQSNDKVLKETYSGGSYANSTLVVDTTNLQNLAGIAVDGSGNVYVLDTGSGVSQVLGGSLLPVSTSSLNYPTGLAADPAGNLYIADSNHNRVIKETANGGGSFTESTVADGSNGIVYPGGVGVDASGNVYITDYDLVSTNVVYKETFSGGSYTQSQLPFSGLNLPSGIGVDPSGNIFLDDVGNARFLELETRTVNFSSVAAGSSSGAVALNFSIASGTLVASIVEATTGLPIADFSDAGGSTCTVTTYASDTNCVVNVKFAPPVTGLLQGAVVFDDVSGNQLGSVPLFGIGTGPQIAYEPGTASALNPTAGGTGLNEPLGMVVDAADDLYIADSSNNRILIVPAGSSTGFPITPAPGGVGLSFPGGLALDGAGDLYIADFANNRIVKVPAGSGAAIAITPKGATLNGAAAVAVDTAGNLFVADDFNNRVVEIPANGGAAIIINPTVNGLSLSEPGGVTVDAAGDLYIADSSNSRIVEIPAGGGSPVVIHPTVNGLQLSFPSGVALDAAGDLYIADFLNGRVVEVPAGGGAAVAFDPTVAGKAIKYAQAVAVTGAGDLIIDDYINSPTGSRILEIQRSQIPGPFSFATTNVGALSTDSPQTVEIENIGNQALTLTGLSYPVDFSVDGSDLNPCTGTTSLIAGNTCDVSIDFIPVSAGAPLSEEVTLTDNALNAAGAQQNIGVSGTATAQVLAGFTLDGGGPAPFYTADGITITAIDTLGNTDTGYNGTATLTTNDPIAGMIPSNQVSFSHGVGSVTMVFKTAGTHSLTATDNADSSITGTQSYTVSPGPANEFVVSASSSATSGSPITFTVTAYDIISNVATGYAGTMTFTSSDPSSRVALPSPATLINGTGTFQATLATPGTQTITATDAVTNAPDTLTSTSGAITVVAPNLVVTSSPDGSPNLKGCTPQVTPGSGTDAGCTLRDALAFAANAGAGNITFDATAFGTATTVPIPIGTLSIPSNTTITGRTSGAGASLTNLTTVSGQGASQVFNVTKGVTAAAINNLIITDGSVVGAGGIPHLVPVTGGDSQAYRVHPNAPPPTVPEGGGIENSGVLTVTNSTISGNSVSNTGGNEALGGGIFNGGTLTLIGSTVSGNTASGLSGSQPYGGGIYNLSSLTLINTTIAANAANGGGLGNGGGIYTAPNATLTATNTTVSANSVDGDGGGIYHPPATSPIPTLANTVVAGNSSGDSQDLDGGFIDNGGNQVGGTIQLAALGNNGGPTQTMLPLPGSPAICGGTLANASAASVIADQRGFGFDPACPAGENLVDSGAVQVSYALAFTTEPPAFVVVGAKFAPAPAVQLTESGNVGTAAAGSVAMSDSNSALGGTLAASLASGSATFSNLRLNTATVADTLTATLTLNSATTPPVTVSAIATPTVNADVQSALITPAPGSTLPGPSVTFTWTTVSGATGYQFWLGSTGRGSNNLYSSGETRDAKFTSVTIDRLPTNGEAIYARLYTNFNGVWVRTDYTFTAPTQAAITSPTNSSALSGFNTTFTWSPGTGATAYLLWVGAGGVNTADIYSSGVTTSTSADVKVPANGETVYARLYTEFNGTWVHTDYTFTAPTLTLATLISPTPGSTLTDTSATFSWTAGEGATGYDLWLGSTGIDSHDIYSSGEVFNTSFTSVTVPNIPTNGETIYVRLYTCFNGTWKNIHYTLVAGSQPALVSPVPGSTLAGPSVTFTWSASGGATAYQLWLGSTGKASHNLYTSGVIAATSATAINLPTNGEAINARLYSLISGVWNHLDYVYTAGPAPAIISPAPGSTLTSTSQTFQWSAGTGVTAYNLWLGSTGVASHDLHVSGVTTGTQESVNNLPVNGETVYARLYVEIDGVWSHLDYTYTAYSTVP